VNEKIRENRRFVCSPLKQIFSGRTIQQRWWGEDSRADWVKTLAADFFDEGIQKLVPRYDKCLSLGGDYVEK
jgi:hypothetical protein